VEPPQAPAEEAAVQEAPVQLELPPPPRPARLERSLSPQRNASGRIKADPELGALARQAETGSSPVRSGSGIAEDELWPQADVEAARERRKREIALAALRASLPEMTERSAAAPGSKSVVRRTFSVKLASERPEFAKILHVNEGDETRTYHLRSSHPALATLQPQVVTLRPGDEVDIAVVLAPLEQWGPAARAGSEDVLLFINDENDVNVNIFKCRVFGAA